LHGIFLENFLPWADRRYTSSAPAPKAKPLRIG